MISIDLESATVAVEREGELEVYGLGTPEGFAVISDIWLRAGWDSKYVYSFSWFGRPVIQLPEDLIRIQEIIYSVAPDVIIETGVAHGGSLVFYASLCKGMDRGRVVGVDVDIRSHNRTALESHPLFPFITLIEGNSTDAAVVERVSREVYPGESVLVLLDSCHTKEHVLAELRAYAPLVTPGSFIVAMDGIMKDVAGASRTSPDWVWNNPREAAIQFVRENPDYVIVEPALPFNEGITTQRVTYWPDGFIQRVR